MLCWQEWRENYAVLRGNTEQRRTFIASTIKIVILPLSRQRIRAVVRMSDPLAAGLCGHWYSSYPPTKIFSQGNHIMRFSDSNRQMRARALISAGAQYQPLDHCWIHPQVFVGSKALSSLPSLPFLQFQFWSSWYPSTSIMVPHTSFWLLAVLYHQIKLDSTWQAYQMRVWKDPLNMILVFRNVQTPQWELEIFNLDQKLPG